jgi:PAS domain S-box-containing protein
MMTTGAIVYPSPEHSASVRARLDRATLTIVAHAHPLPSEVRRQRLLEQEVRDREARLKSILDTAADAILTVDEDGLVETMNNSATRTFDVEAAEVVQKPVDGILPGLTAVLTSASSASPESRARELIGLRGVSGTAFPVEVSYSDLSTGGRRTRIVIARDLTHRKELEAAINHSKRLDAIGQLAAGIAHEINTPIQYVGDNARFLRESFDDILALLPKYELLKTAAERGTIAPEVLEQVLAAEAGVDLAFLCEEIPQAIAQALEGVERVASIVAAMKAFSHPGKDKVPSDINKALQTTITVCRNEWKYVADLTTTFDETLPLISCVIGEVNQVFINLIVNAAHAIAEKAGDSGEMGLITIETRREEPFVEICISDSGNGIPAALRDKVFEPFFTTKDVGKGTGQGLSLSHSVIVKKHGGQLFFKSDEGVGTTFYVRLPIDQESQP